MVGDAKKTGYQAIEVYDDEAPTVEAVLRLMLRLRWRDMDRLAFLIEEARSGLRESRARITAGDILDMCKDKLLQTPEVAS